MISKVIRNTLLSFLLTVPASLAAENANRVVILHTNDTHSQIEPARNGLGGVVRRKAAVDSVRHAEPHVLLVDAGDAVQGTLYFTLFAGEVEQMVLNDLGYDVQILGNHEFDNGMEPLAKAYSHALPTIVSSNYDVSATPLKPLFHPYVVKQVGPYRIGFIGINIRPDGLINYRNITGVVFNDAIEAANRTAAHLREHNQVDAVVALTHVGYTKDANRPHNTDGALVANTRGIDVVIGGHSHSDLRPEDTDRIWLTNLDGDSVLVVQNAARGVDVGEVVLTFAPDNSLAAREWGKIRIDSRFDDRLPQDLADRLAPYKAAIDSIGAEPVATLAGDFNAQAMLNFMADFIMERGGKLMPGLKPDLSIVNKGGIRQQFAGPKLTTGQVISAFPFENLVLLLEVKGSDLIELFDILARQKGNGVSSTVKAVMAPDYSHCESVKIGGKPIDPERTYLVATIDYLVGGGDNMTPLKRGKIIAESEGIIYEDMLAKFRATHPVIKANDTPRMIVNSSK